MSAPFYVQPDGRPVYMVRARGAARPCSLAPAPAIEGYERVGCDLYRGRGTRFHVEYWRPVLEGADGTLDCRPKKATS